MKRIKLTKEAGFGVFKKMNLDVEKLYFSDVFAASTEQTETSKQDVGVGHEPYRLDGVTRVAPAAPVRIKPIGESI